jgi:G3E family GTPase
VCTEDHDHSEHDHKDHDHKDHDHKDHDHKDHDHKDHDHKDHDHSEHDHKPKKKKKKTHNLSLVSSVGFTIDGLLDVPVFNTFMSDLLQRKAADIYRSKGVLAFADQGDTKFVFQGVHDNITFEPTDKPWKDGEPRVSKMVFIGKDLDYEGLKQGLLNCTVEPASTKITMHKRA